jgi:hypothetical protein
MPDKFSRLRPEQVLCSMSGCERPAIYLLERDVDSEKPALFAYCEAHAKQISRDLRIPLP